MHKGNSNIPLWNSQHFQSHNLLTLQKYIQRNILMQSIINTCEPFTGGRFTTYTQVHTGPPQHALTEKMVRVDSIFVSFAYPKMNLL